jgi:hypothetical protein
MDCPVCKHPLVILELNNVEIDHCTQCEGIWLDGDELEILLEDSEAKHHLLSTFTVDNSNSEKPLKCPICRKKMDKVLCGDDKSVLIDQCKNHHGLWFDRGELESLLELGSFDKHNKVLTLIKEMFGHKLNINKTGA